MSPESSGTSMKKTASLLALLPAFHFLFDPEKGSDTFHRNVG
jgi:hypothetical protein